MSEMVSKSFTVDTNSSLLFDILRSKIYSDPVASIVQEIISNARDAHRELNKKESIQVGIDYNFFSVRDFGLGISPDRMENIFLKYLATTKIGDDKQTGGFGLGAKTPFAYADSFEIITVFEGVKYQYLASIGGESASGEVLLVDSSASTDASGTLIRVPLKSSDNIIFKARFDEFIRNFNYPIKFTLNGNKYKDYPGMDQKSRFFYKTYSEKSHLILDGISYPLDLNNIKEIVSNTDLNSLLRDNDVCLVFDNRSLDVSVNRELIRYTDRTKAALKDKLLELLASERARAKALIATFEKFNYISNYYQILDAGLLYFMRTMSEPDYFVNSLAGYKVYNDGKIPDYCYTYQVNNLGRDDQIIYLDKEINEVSPASVKKYMKEYNLDGLMFVNDNRFNIDLYKKASVTFDQKKEVKASSLAKKIFFRLNKSGDLKRIAASEIDSSKINILMDFHRASDTHTCLITDKVDILAMKEGKIVKELLEDERFTDISDHLATLLPKYLTDYTRMKAWSKTSMQHRYSYNRFYGLDNNIKFLKKYNERHPDMLVNQITEYYDLIPRHVDYYANSQMLQVMSLHEMPAADSSHLLDEEQLVKLENLIISYLDDKIPLYKFLKITPDNQEQIINLL